MSIGKLKQKENSQISRLFALKDPNVDIIYVSPYPITDEVFEYYLNIFEMLEFEDAKRRITVVVPENYVKFRDHYSLSQQLLYSPKALNSIKKLSHGKSTYIIPGKGSTYDYQLSVQISVPILYGDVDVTNKFETKSGARDLFSEAKIPIAIGAAISGQNSQALSNNKTKSNLSWKENGLKQTASQFFE